MAKAVSYDLAPFDARLHVATSRKQIKALCSKYNLAKPTSVGATWLTVKGARNQVHIVVYIDMPADTLELVDLIAHEASHVAAWLLDHIGQRADRNDSEVLAYLTGWAAARIWESLP